MKNMQNTQITVANIACQSSDFSMSCLALIMFWSPILASCFVTNIAGNTNPIATPRVYEVEATVVAITLSFSPNHYPTSFAGAHTRKG